MTGKKKEKKEKYQRQVEGILKRVGFGDEPEYHLKTYRSRIDAFCDILERAGDETEIADLLTPPHPWSSIFPVIFQTLLDEMPPLKACKAAFALGQLWKMHEEELLNTDYQDRQTDRQIDR